MRAILRLFFGLAIVAVAALLVLGYLGFVPAVAGVFGSDKPRDLGVRATQADLQSANEKTKVKLVQLPATTSPQESLKYSGQIPASATFSDRELTALINNGKWKHNPVADCQVKIGSDGAVEASGMLRMDRVPGYAAATGVSAETVNAVVDRLKIAANSSPPFYLKGTASVANNRVTIDAQQVEVGRFPVPSGWISDYKGAVVGFVEDRIRRVPGLSVKSLTFANGSAKFDGTLPEVEATAHN